MNFKKKNSSLSKENAVSSSFQKHQEMSLKKTPKELKEAKHQKKKPAEKRKKKKPP